MPADETLSSNFIPKYFGQLTSEQNEMLQTYSQLMAPEELNEIFKENFDSKNQFATEPVRL